MHAGYGSDVQCYTDSVDESCSWVHFDGHAARIRVAGYIRRAAVASHKRYSAVVKTYDASRMSSTVFSITGKRLNAATNALADLIIGSNKGVRSDASAGGLSAESQVALILVPAGPASL